MAATVRVIDEHFGGASPVRRAGLHLRLASERVTPREIIRSRVEAEVEELNQRKREVAAASTRSYFVEQGSREALFNAVGVNTGRRTAPVEVEAEVERAITAFRQRRFIMLFDERQIDDLDETIGLRAESDVVFVHLLPLKGG